MNAFCAFLLPSCHSWLACSRIDHLCCSCDEPFYCLLPTEAFKQVSTLFTPFYCCRLSCCALTIQARVAADLKFVNSSRMKPRWLVVAMVLPTEDVLFLHYKVPTIIMSRTCDQNEKVGPVFYPTLRQLLCWRQLSAVCSALRDHHCCDVAVDTQRLLGPVLQGVDHFSCGPWYHGCLPVFCFAFWSLYA